MAIIIDIERKVKNIDKEVYYERDLFIDNKISKNTYLESLDIFIDEMEDLTELVFQLYQCKLIPETKFNTLIDILNGYQFKFNQIYNSVKGVRKND